MTDQPLTPDPPDDRADGRPAAPSVSRRRFIQSAGAGLIGAALATDALTRTAGAAGTSAANAARAAAIADPQKGELTPLPGVVAGDGTLGAVPFHGPHQAGILTTQPPAAAFVAFDLLASNPGEVKALFQELTSLARFLTAGGTPANLGIGSPPSDSGILGPVVPADALTFTVGVGSSLFDDRYGLAKALPRRLTTMTPFPNDNLNQAECHGDLMLQICAGSPDTTLHALRLVAKHTRGAMQVRYRIDGFVSPPRPSGAPRNLQGFNDGIANPSVHQPAVADALLWAGNDEPAWTRGGSYQVVRIIRMFVEFWDRVSLEEQETMIGRRRGSGAPLTGNQPGRRPRLRRRPERGDHPRERPHPAGQPPDAGHGIESAPAARLQLRPGYRRHRPARPGPRLRLLPAGPSAPVRDRPAAAPHRAARRLHQPHRRRLLLRPSRRQRRARLVRPGPAHLTPVRRLT